MTAKPPSLPQPPRRRVFRFLLKAFAAILVVLLVWHISFRIRTHREIKRLEAKARANGEPWTLAELAATYYAPIPDEENAAIPLMDLWEEEDPEYWKAVGEKRRAMPRAKVIEIPDELESLGKPQRSATSEQYSRYVPGSGRGEPPKPIPAAELLERVSRFLDQHALHLEAVRGALRRSSARFPVRFEEGHLSSLFHLTPLQAEAKLFDLDCRRWIEMGDGRQAADSAMDLLRLGRLLRDDPDRLSQSIRIGIDGRVCTLLPGIVVLNGISQGQLLELQKLLEPTDDPALTKTMLLAERGLGLSLLDSYARATPISGEGGRRNSSADGIWMRATGEILENRRFFLEKMGAAIEIETVGGTGRFEEIAKLQSEIGHTRSAFLAKLLPSVNALSDRNALLCAASRASLTAVAVERFRKANGRVPSDLAALVPEYLKEIPSDPFDGLPMRYKPNESGYVVYSVGMDKKDNGGAPANSKTPASQRFGTDECFVVER